MNLTCDLCNGPLEKVPNDTQMVCSVCGLIYAEERVQEKRLMAAKPMVNSPKAVDNAFDFQGTEQEYFAEILRREFPEYVLRENVQHRELTIPINHVLCQGDYPVIAIFLIDRNDSAAQFQANKATKILGAAGVSCISFVTKCRNEAPYVVQRVRSSLPKR